jgi:hypothetical protein
VPTRTRAFEVILYADNVLRYIITTDSGRVADFLLQFETNAAGRFLPVIRYDCAHGYLHRDVMDPQGRQVSKQPVSIGPTMTMKQALADAESDLRGNWPQYRDQFLRQVGRQ